MYGLKVLLKYVNIYSIVVQNLKQNVERMFREANI